MCRNINLHLNLRLRGLGKGVSGLYLRCSKPRVELLYTKYGRSFGTNTIQLPLSSFSSCKSDSSERKGRDCVWRNSVNSLSNCRNVTNVLRSVGLTRCDASAIPSRRYLSSRKVINSKSSSDEYQWGFVNQQPKSVNEAILRNALSQDLPLVAYINLLQQATENQVNLTSHLPAIVDKVVYCDDDVSYYDLSQLFVLSMKLKFSSVDLNRMGEALLARLPRHATRLESKVLSRFSIALQFAMIDPTIVNRYTSYFVSCEEELSAKDIVRIIRNCSGLSSLQPDVQELIDLCSSTIESEHLVLEGLDLVTALIGFGAFRSVEPSVCRLLQAMLNAVPADLPELPSVWSPQIAKALGNLSGMNSLQPEVLALIKCITQLMPSEPNRPLDPQQLSRILNGLGELNSNREETCEILEKLIPWFHTCTRPLNAQDTTLALSSLHQKSSEKSVVMEVVSIILRLVNYDSSFDAPCRHLEQAVMGLRRFDKDDSEVHRVMMCLIPYLQRGVPDDLAGMPGMLTGLRKLRVPRDLETADGSSVQEQYLRAIVDYLERAKSLSGSTFYSQKLKPALLSLQALPSSSQDVRRLLTLVATMVPNCSDPVMASDIFLAISGLRCCSSQHPEVIIVIDALLPLLIKSEGPITAAQFALGMIGLQSMSNLDSSIVSELFLTMISKRSLLDEDDSLNSREIYMIVDSLAHMNIDTREVRTLIRFLHKHLENCPSTSFYDFRCDRIKTVLTRDDLSGKTANVVNSFLETIKEKVQASDESYESDAEEEH